MNDLKHKRYIEQLERERLDKALDDAIESVHKAAADLIEYLENENEELEEIINEQENE